MKSDKFWLFILVGVGLALAGFATRVTDYHIPDFMTGVAAGWLDVDDGRSHPMMGSFPQHKYGFNTDIDNAEETIYEGSELSGPARIIVDTTAFTLYISSDNGADTEAGNVDILVEGLDQNWDRKSVTVTAAGNTAGDGGMAGVTFVQVGAASSWMRVNRVKNIGTAGVTGDIYVHTDGTDANADGIPDSPSTELRTVVSPNENQTLQAFYTIPRNFIGLMKEWCFSALTSSGTTNPATVRLRVHPNGMIDRTQDREAIANADTTCIPFDPPMKFNGKDGIEVTAISTGAASNVDVTSRFHMAILPD